MARDPIYGIQPEINQRLKSWASSIRRKRSVPSIGCEMRTWNDKGRRPALPTRTAVLMMWQIVLQQTARPKTSSGLQLGFPRRPVLRS